MLISSEPAEVLKLVREFASLLDPENDYQKWIRPLKTRALRAQAEQTLAAGDKQGAIALYERPWRKIPMQESREY